MIRKRTVIWVAGAAVAFLAIALAGSNPLPRLSQQSAEDLYQAALMKAEAEGDLSGAIKLFQDVISKFPEKRDIAAKAQLQIGICYEKLGLKQAQEAYQKVIEKYPDQSDAVSAARAKLALLARAQAAPEKSGQELSMRRVYDGTALEWGNALSSDGRYLVYTNWDNGDLAVVDLVTNKTRPLTNKGGLYTKSGAMGETSAFSPDDKQVAYCWTENDNVPELWVINFDGSNPRRLYRDEQSAWIRPHDWSLDGQQILIINMKKEGSTQVALVSASDGTVRVLRDVSAQDPELDLSPDGRFVACSMAPEPSSSKRDVFIVNASDGQISPLVAHAADDYSLGWAPDGKTLLFASDRTGAYGLWGINVSDGRAQGSPYLIKAAINQADPVRLAPDGRLYYVLTETIMDIYTAVIDPDTGKVQGQPTAVPTRYSGANTMVDWSPDGKRLAYLTNPGGLFGPNWPAVISIQDVRTGEERQLTPKIGGIIPSHGLRWAPDGRSVLVIGQTGQETAIYKVDVDSGAPNPLVIIPKFQFTLHVAWSADGKCLFYPQGNPTRILRRDLDTGMETELATMTGPAGIPIVAASLDGRWLAFTSQEATEQNVRLMIVPSAGGEVRELFQTTDKGYIRDLNWTADSRFLWFRSMAHSDDPKLQPKWESWRVSLDGSNLQKLELIVPGLGIRLHPGGRQIAYYSGRSRRDLWIMENFLQAVQASMEKDAGKLRIQKVWDAEMYDWFVGSPSPDGRYLTYSSEQSFLSLGVRDLIKGESRLIRANKSWADSDGESCSYSIFSPDGSQIAYSCQVGRRYQLRIVNFDGTSMRILHDGSNVNILIPENLTPFGWTPDGKQILTLLSREDNISRIAFISALDGSIKYEKALSLTLSWKTRLSLSPDGKYIAGSYLPRADSANQDIFLLRIDGGREATLVEHPADDQLIGWSPDGKQVLFVSDRTGTEGIWAVPVSDGKAKGAPELVRDNVGNILPLGMTRDGKLYYGIATGSSDVFIAPIDPSTGKVTGQPEKAFRKYETFNSAPDWSPDSQFLACRSSRGKSVNESPGLLIRSMQTNEVRELVPKTPRGRLSYYWLRWSPDGRSFLSGGQDENGQVGALLSVDAQTGAAKIIARADSGVDGTGGVIAPECSSDGKTIYFVRIGDEFRRVCRLDLETGLEKELCRFSEAESGPFWLASSPDGRQLALHAEGKIKILSSDGAQSRDLTEAERGMVLAWTADGKHILFRKPQKENKDAVELWIVPAGGGEPQKAGLSMPHLMMLRVSPDGKHIAFTSREQPEKYEVWVMENFLPKEKSAE